MHRPIPPLAVALVGLLLAGPAAASTVITLNSDFESPTFTVGNIANDPDATGQGGWGGSNSVIEDSQLVRARIVDDKAYTGTQSLRTTSDTRSILKALDAGGLGNPGSGGEYPFHSGGFSLPSASDWWVQARVWINPGAAVRFTLASGLGGCPLIDIGPRPFFSTPVGTPYANSCVSQSGPQETLGDGAFGQWLLLEMVHTAAMGAGMEMRITGPGISRTIPLGSYSGPGSGNPAYVGLSGDAWWDDVRAGYGPVPADTAEATPTETPTEAPTPTPTDTPAEATPATPPATPTATATATATPDPTLCAGVPGCGDHYLAFRIKAPKKDALGAAIAANPFPRDFVITLNDVRLDDADADDPENFVVRKEKSLLNAAKFNDEAGPNWPGLRYVRYQTGGGKEGVGPADGRGRYPKAAKHGKRVWQLENGFGTINVVSKKQSALLVPAAASDSPGPVDPGDATHFTCYQVKATKDISGQTPDTGRGAGKFRKDLQAFFDDSLFGDCAVLADGVTPSFPGTAVAGSCLFDLTKPVELCNPADKTAVEPPRTTAAVIDESIAASDKSLLCYKVKRAKKLKHPAAAALVGGNVGDKLAPKQAKHAKRSVKAGDPVYVKAGNRFPAPVMADTRGDEMACLPTTVLGVAALP